MTKGKEMEEESHPPVYRDRLDVMGQMLNDCIGAIHATQILDHKTPDEDNEINRILGKNSLNTSETTSSIKEVAGRLILRIVNEYEEFLNETGAA